MDKIIYLKKVNFESQGIKLTQLIIEGLNFKVE